MWNKSHQLLNHTGLEYTVGDKTGIQVIKEPHWAKDDIRISLSVVVLSAPKHFQVLIKNLKNTIYVYLIMFIYPFYS